MTARSVEQAITNLLGESDRPLRFREISQELGEKGISKSQVHNAVYRLGKSGALLKSGHGSTMSYKLSVRHDA